MNNLNVYNKKNLSNRYHRGGFTLMELLISLFIFAILGTLLAVAIHMTIHTYQHIKRSNRQLSKIIIATTLMRRDINQAIRYDSDKGDVMQPSQPNIKTQYTFHGNGNKFTFTRTGFINPFQIQKRSELESVTYQLSGNQLLRATQLLQMDRSTEHVSNGSESICNASDNGESSQVLLTDVHNVNIQYVYKDGNHSIKYSHIWPLQSQTNTISNKKVPSIPLAIMVSFDALGVRHINDIFLVSGGIS